MMNIITSLNNKGYGIKKTENNQELIKKIKQELLVSPKVFSNAAFSVEKEYPIYLENDNKLYVPKCYGIEKFGFPLDDKLSFGVDCPLLEFNGKLRDVQQEPINAFIDNVNKKKKLGGIISVPCGFGKTIMAIYVACYFKKKTLFISHKDFLNEQFINSIKMFVPEARIGKIKQNKVDVENKDIVIATLQSLAIRDYDPAIFNEFGLVIIDECHHIASEVFSRAFRKMNIRITLGLSATLNRKDGLRKVFEWYLGKSVYKIKNNCEDCDMIVNLHKYYVHDLDYSYVKMMYNGTPNIVSMVNNICNFKPRTQFIINLLKEVLKKEPERKILILSERKNQLKDLEEFIKNDEIASYGYYVGGMKMSDLDISATKQIILATYQMSSEGLNIPTLNTVILASPIGDIQQSVGRILREKKNERKYVPLCIDIYDDFSVFKFKGNKRIKYYKSNGYKINNYIDYDLIEERDEDEERDPNVKCQFIDDDE
uniref:Helicase ATP-binding domain-containing protein n=1 Tax=viral metagenome TaxID=1070528 RepID=A0A6C0CG78_9ZZZZ